MDSKRNAVQQFATLMSEECELDGIGSPVWKELWSAARKYSLEVAYPEREFPYVEQESHCVLCHQPLSSEATSRLNRFEEFTQGELERTLVLSVQAYEKAIRDTEYTLSIDSVNTKIDAAVDTRRLRLSKMGHCRQRTLMGACP